MSSPLPPDHFLSQPRLDLIGGGGRVVDGFVDTATLAAHDFDVDTRTGFMPPEPPISRLPTEWEPWETTLEQGLSIKLQLAVKPDLTEQEMAQSASWRECVRDHLPILPTKSLTASELLLRRAHHVLTFIMHLYIHTLPLHAEIRIPPPVSVPLLQVAAFLQLPPVATYSDTVLYNWHLASPTEDTAPALENLRSQDLFTGTNDEQEFFLASSRIEIRGVEALELMRATMDEMFVGDDIAVRRITGYLHQLARVVDALTHILLDVRKGCDPEFFYHCIRPWFRGQDSDPMNRKWIFEGLDDGQHPELEPPTDLSGPSAGQSALIHALGIFLGLDSESTGQCHTLTRDDDRWTLLRRMQIYMPKRHRDFLRHLSADPRPVRNLAISGDHKLVESYNDAVGAVKQFRDAHLKIVALYIIGPASRERQAVEARGAKSGKEPPLKGTGGTHLMQFLKGVRDQTAEAVVDIQSPGSKDEVQS